MSASYAWRPIIDLPPSGGVSTELWHILVGAMEYHNDPRSIPLGQESITLLNAIYFATSSKAMEEEISDLISEIRKNPIEIYRD